MLYRKCAVVCSFSILAGLGGCVAGTSTTAVDGSSAPLQRILFVGDSFTHGRYAPVQQYGDGGAQNATQGYGLVVDENYGQMGPRAELEQGPWGGIPGIFARLTVEAGLNYDVHIEAISETSLDKNYAAASSVIDQPKWNAIVLQELSSRPIPESLSMDSTSDPKNFCTTVQTIEQGVHAAAPSANVYLYETWPRADLAKNLAGDPSASGFTEKYANALAALDNAYHNVYYSAALHDGAITAVSPAGDAWIRAWAEGVANPDPFNGGVSAPSLWYGINAVNNPAITQPDYLHPSVWGAYLSALVLFQQITGKDVRAFGANEMAASQLGLSGTIAEQLQQVAWEQVTQEIPAPQSETVDPCTLTK